MAVQYSFSEMADMHLTLGKCDGNASAAAELYARRFPRRRHPQRRTFLGLNRRLREHGSFKVIRTGRAGRPRSTRTVAFEEEVLEEIENQPQSSCRRLASALNRTKNSIWETLHEQQLHPFHFRKVQDLLVTDYLPRITYCTWFLNEARVNNQFTNIRILFTDEARFTKNGVMNSRNAHYWAQENPRQKKQVFSNKFFIKCVGRDY